MLAAKSISRLNIASLLMALGSAVIWSTTPVVVKIGLGYLGPFTIAALRFTLGGLILLPFVLRESGGPAGLRAYPRRYVRLAVIMGVCAHLLGDGLSYLSLTMLPASTVGFLNILVPVIPVLIGVVWLRERPGLWQVVGWLTVFNSIIAFLLYNTALKHLTILETNAVMGLIPVASALLSVAVLGDRFGWAQAAAMVVVLGGAALVQVTKKEEAGY